MGRAAPVTCPGELVRIDDTSLWVVRRGRGLPVFVLHGGPGLDHHEFGDYLDPLGDRCELLFVDLRAQGRSEKAPSSTWTLERMAQDVIMLARALGLERYAVLGHSYGAFVALQNAVDFPGMTAATIVSSGLPSMRFFDAVEQNLAAFEPVSLREQVTSSWDREAEAATQEDVASLLHDQLPFQFGDPLDPRIEEYERRSEGAVFAPDVLRHFAASSYGGIELEDRLGDVRSRVLVLAGRFDRVCLPVAAEAIAKGIPGSRLHVFEQSGHMTFVEQNEEYLRVVGDFLAEAASSRARPPAPVA
ncbi:MAG TPA: alpha/beta fold hydrolase [Actinomycetota bacterium]